MPVKPSKVVRKKVSDVLGKQDTSPASVAVAETEPAPVQDSTTKTENPEPNYPSRHESSNRISIPLDKLTGKIDWASMQERTKERAAEALKKSMPDAEFIKVCGIAPLAVTAKPEIVTTASAGVLLDVIARVEAGVYAKKTGLEYDEVYQVVQWDRDDHRILDAQVSGLANKYIPAAWLQYADLGIFASTMFGLMKQKAELVEQLAKKRFNGIVTESKQSSSASTLVQPLTGTPAPSTPPASPVAEIPPGDAARSLENFAADSPTGTDNHRSLG